jgi:hypothetical protein
LYCINLYDSYLEHNRLDCTEWPCMLCSWTCEVCQQDMFILDLEVDSVIQTILHDNNAMGDYFIVYSDTGVYYPASEESYQTGVVELDMDTSKAKIRNWYLDQQGNSKLKLF